MNEGGWGMIIILTPSLVTNKMAFKYSADFPYYVIELFCI